MNRAERRRDRPRKARVRLGRVQPEQDMATVVKCPDCNSDAAVVEVEPGYFRGVVQHDDSCPWYAALKRDLR